MFLINAIYASASIAFMVVLLLLIHYLSPTSSWGYISQALIFHQVRLRRHTRTNTHSHILNTALSLQEQLKSQPTAHPPLSSTRVWASAKQSFHQVYRAAHMRTHTHAKTHTRTHKHRQMDLCCLFLSQASAFSRQTNIVPAPPLTHKHTHCCLVTLAAAIHHVYISLTRRTHTQLLLYVSPAKKKQTLCIISNTHARAFTQTCAYTASHGPTLNAWQADWSPGEGRVLPGRPVAGGGALPEQWAGRVARRLAGQQRLPAACRETEHYYNHLTYWVSFLGLLLILLFSHPAPCIPPSSYSFPSSLACWALAKTDTGGPMLYSRQLY